MKLSSRLEEITNFLTEYDSIWNREILPLYPNHKIDYPNEWIDMLSNLDDRDLSMIAGRVTPKSIQGSALESLIHRINLLTNLERIELNDTSRLDHFGRLNMSGKKQHELTQLELLLRRTVNDIEHVVDIGGGQGYLANIVAKYYGKDVITIDKDKALVAQGIRSNTKNRRLGEGSVKFISADFNTMGNELDNYLQSKTICIGLHTCGELADALISRCIKNKTEKLVSIGCCYNRLNGKRLPTSDYGKKIKRFELSDEALTLSTRSHALMNHDEFSFKKRVKFYRYALHLFLYEECGIIDFIPFGSSKKSFYAGEFSIYAKEQFRRVDNLHHLLTRIDDKTLDSFIMRDLTIKVFEELFSIGIIRDIFGRPIELYILTDRGLLLEESGYSVHFFELFKEEISPRNICIFASLT